MGKINNAFEKKGYNVGVMTSPHSLIGTDIGNDYATIPIRELAYKVDVLLYIIDRLAKCLYELYHLSDTNNTGPMETIDFFISGLANSILRVITKKKTVKVVSTFSQKLSSVYSEILLEKNKISGKHREIDRLSHLIKSSFIEQSYLVELIRQNNLIGNGKRNILARMIKELVYKQMSLKDYEHKLQELLSSQNRDSYYLSQLCILKVEEISGFSVNVVFAFRDELMLQPETDRYLEKSSKIVNPLKANIESFYNDVNDVLKPIFDISQSDYKIFTLKQAGKHPFISEHKKK